ncbi:hypothetical protein KAI92_04120 [Candidatus Parcubacteria bacterium]|nr:hypothetical protein [Candidatus Parcubacteria bacterium]
MSENSEKNEALYLEYLWYFDKISGMIEKEKPRRISPSWFRKKEVAFLSMMTRKFTGNSKEMWLFISKKLKIENIFVIQKKKCRTFNEAIEELENFLDENQPDKFCSEWILIKSQSLHQYFCRNIKNDDELPDWDKIIYALDEKWRNIFFYNKREQRKEKRTMESCIVKIEALARKQKATKITPKWISNNLKQEYCFILSKLKRRNNVKSWKPFLDKCPKYIRDIWHNDVSRQFTKKTAVKTLISLLEEKKPESFSRRWIEVSDNGLYLYLIRYFRNSNNKVNWTNIIMRLPKEWHRKWDDYIKLELLFMEYFESYYEIFQEPITIQNKKLNEIFVKLIEFRRNGNIFAEKRILSMLVLYIFDWFTNNELFTFFRIDKTKLDKEIINFLNSYDELKGVFLPDFRRHLENVARKSR